MKESPKYFPNVPVDFPKGSRVDSPKDFPGDISKYSPMDFHKGSLKESPKCFLNDSPEDSHQDFENIINNNQTYGFGVQNL